MGHRPTPRGGSAGGWFCWVVLVWSWLVWLWFGYGWFWLWLVLVWRVVSLVIGFAGWILAGRSLKADLDDVECRYTGGPNLMIKVGQTGVSNSSESLKGHSAAERKEIHLPLKAKAGRH